MYRALGSGAEGSDVRELEENLAALGYGGFTVDDSFSSGTADAVRSFQEDRGLPETGRLRPDEVVIAAAAIRVTTLTATLGGPAAGPVLAYTETTRAVSIALDVAKQHLVTVGVTAEIELPDGSTVEGEVSQVGTVATVGASASGPTIEVTVAVADQAALGTLDAAPVTVTLQADRAQDVLTVPVAALLALSEGGYGVQIVEGDTTRYVAVNLGMFANGRVEISGDAIAEGVVVGMPS
jgi:peptidoglycan hydrolase-like protein with peptidoglycan-binding domain